MEVNIIFKIAAVGIVVTIINQVLKASGRDDQAFYVTLCGVVIVIYWILPYISSLFATMETMLEIG